MAQAPVHRGGRPRNADPGPAPRAARTQNRERVICKCGQDITELVAHSGTAVHLHNQSREHIEALARLEQDRRPEELENPQAGPVGGAGPRPPGSRAPSPAACQGLLGEQLGFRRPFCENYPWQVHASDPPDLAIIWRADTNGRLFSMQCTRRRVPGRETCDACHRLRTAALLRSFIQRTHSDNPQLGLASMTYSQLLRYVHVRLPRQADELERGARYHQIMAVPPPMDIPGQHIPGQGYMYDQQGLVPPEQLPNLLPILPQHPLGIAPYQQPGPQGARLMGAGGGSGHPGLPQLGTHHHQGPSPSGHFGPH
eukprot:jgi/Botrbrau1/11784/Bobra.0195s0108.1